MLAQIVDRNRLSAILFVAVGLLVPLGVVISGAVTALITLRRGWADGALVGAAGFALIVGLLLYAGLAMDWGVLAQGLLLAGVVAAAQVLRTTQSLAAALWVVLASCLAGLLAYWLINSDPVGYWQQAFSAMLEQFAQSEQGLDANEEAMLASLQWRGVTGHVFGCCFLLASGGLFMGRNWQAGLVNPGGFSSEFHRLALGRALAIASATLFMVAGLAQADLLLNLAAVLIYVWMVAGFAVIHGLVGVLQLGKAWIWSAYLLTLLSWAGASPVFLLVPLIGLVNEFVDLREVAQRKKNAGS